MCILKDPVGDVSDRDKKLVQRGYSTVAPGHDSTSGIRLVRSGYSSRVESVRNDHSTRGELGESGHLEVVRGGLSTGTENSEIQPQPPLHVYSRTPSLTSRAKVSRVRAWENTIIISGILICVCVCVCVCVCEFRVAGEWMVKGH